MLTATSMTYAPTLLHRKVMMGNSVKGAGASALAQLHASASLRGLYLDLSWNEVDNRGMATLALLKKAPSLQEVHLVLMFNEASFGMNALLSLKQSPTLRRLTMNTRHNVFPGKGNPLHALSRREWLDVVELGVRMLALGLLLYAAAHWRSGQMVAGLIIMLPMLRPIEQVLPEDARGWMNECLMRLPGFPKPVKKSYLLLLPQVWNSTCGSADQYLSRYILLQCAIWLIFGVLFRAWPPNRAKALGANGVRPGIIAKAAQKSGLLAVLQGVGIVLWEQQPTVTTQVVVSVIWAHVGFYTGIETVEWLEMRAVSRQAHLIKQCVLRR